MKVLMASSATGGHIYPALAIAEQIKIRDPEAQILFVGARKEISGKIVSSEGYHSIPIDISGIHRKDLWKNVITARDIALSSFQVRKILKKFKPDIVIGTGGYVCGPVIREANKAGIKTYIHEQNVIPGVANKLSEKYATKIFIAFEGAAEHFKEKEKIIVTGNPVRKSFFQAERTRNREKFGIKEDEIAILIFGGSQGAHAINDAALDTIEKIGSKKGLHIFVITGRRSYWDIKNKLSDIAEQKTANVRLMDYTTTMNEYFAAVDLIISRSGALTVSEIAISGKASILVPSPNVTGNHQYYNAKALGDVGAAILMNDEELANGGLSMQIDTIITDEVKMKEMGEAAKTIARRDSAEVIFDEICKK